MSRSDDATHTQHELRLTLEVTSDCPGLYAAVMSVDAGDLQRFERLAALAKANELSEVRSFFYPHWAGNTELYGSPDLQEMCFTSDSLWCCGEMVGPFRTADVSITRLREAFDAGVRDVLVTDHNRHPADLLESCRIVDIDLQRAGTDVLVLEAHSELTLEELARRGYVDAPGDSSVAEQGG